MFPGTNPCHRFVFLILVLAGLQVPALGAQGLPYRPWTVTAVFTGFSTGGSAGWVYGPELGIRRDFGRRWGVELSASLPVFDTERYADDGAVALDLGPTITFVTGKSEVGVSAGATGFFVSGGSDFIDGGIGGFVGGHATAWFSKNVGGVVGAKVRLSGGGSAYPSLGAGLAVRF